MSLCSISYFKPNVSLLLKKNNCEGYHIGNSKNSNLGDDCDNTKICERHLEAFSASEAPELSN